MKEKKILSNPVKYAGQEKQNNKINNVFPDNTGASWMINQIGWQIVNLKTLELIPIKLRRGSWKANKWKKRKNNNGHNNGDLGDAERLIFKRIEGIMNALSLFKNEYVKKNLKTQYLMVVDAIYWESKSKRGWSFKVTTTITTTVYIMKV